MSLRQQLIWLVSVIFLMVSAITFYISINNIKSYLETESQINSQNTATSLGLSLSPYISNPQDTILETMVNTIFDHGYYLKIELTDGEGNRIIAKENSATIDGVPSWFIALLPMKTEPARSEISSGWTLGGVLEVTTHPGFGYFKLWQQALNTLTATVIILLIAIAITVTFLSWLLRPLGRIEKLANDIANGQYTQIDPLPKSPEMNQVAITMNTMSSRVRQSIDRMKLQLKTAGDRINIDSLTGLQTKASMELEISERFIHSGGRYLMLIKLHNLERLSRTKNKETVDQYIRGFVGVVKSVLRLNNLATEHFYRLIGSEFILLLNIDKRETCAHLCGQLTTELAHFGEEYEHDNVAHIGVVSVNEESGTASLIAGATEAHDNARLIGPNQFFIRQSTSQARSHEAWVSLVSNIVDQQLFNITLNKPTTTLGDNPLDILMYESNVDLSQNGDVAIGTFIAVAEQTEKIETFDLVVLKKLIELLNEPANKNNRATLNLSLSSITSNTFRSEIFRLLDSQPMLQERIVFSISSYVAAEAKEAFDSFVELAHRIGCKVMIKRFESRFIDMDRLKSVKVDFIRIARSYTDELSSSPQQQAFVEAITAMSELIDLTVLAEDLKSEQERAIAASIGIHGSN